MEQASTPTVAILAKMAHLELFAQVKIPPKFDLDALSASDLADQMTLVAFRTFGSIGARECLPASIKNNEVRKLVAPNLEKMLHFFNSCSTFIQVSILKKTNLKSRVQQLRKAIKMAQRFRKLNNFHILFAVVTGLKSISIHRLSNAWKKLSKKDLTAFEEFDHLFSMKLNYRNLKQALRNCNPPCIPFVGLWMRDMVRIGEHYQSNPKDGTVVDFRALLRVAGRIETMRNWQTGYAMQDNLVVQKAVLLELERCESIDENTLYKMSKPSKQAGWQGFN